MKNNMQKNAKLFLEGEVTDCSGKKSLHFAVFDLPDGFVLNEEILDKMKDDFAQKCIEKSNGGMCSVQKRLPSDAISNGFTYQNLADYFDTKRM